VTIILGDDSLNKTFSLKEQDARNLFFPCKIFKAAAMSGCDRMTTPPRTFRIKLCLLSYYCYLVCCVYLFIFRAFTTLACILVYISMHHFESTHFTI
jgi:hypothetical protein